MIMVLPEELIHEITKQGQILTALIQEDLKPSGDLLILSGIACIQDNLLTLEIQGLYEAVTPVQEVPEQLEVIQVIQVEVPVP